MHTRTIGRVIGLIATLTAVTGIIGIAPANAAGSEQTSFAFVSAPGDYVGAGLSESFAAPATDISVSGSAEDLTVAVSDSSSGEWWYINLAAPKGDVLRPGQYFNAERAPFRTGRAPGLDVYGDGRGCSDVWGSFDINQIRSDASGQITRLDATFEQHCESADAPPMDGVVLFNAPPLSYAFTSDAGDYIGGGQAKTYTGSTSTFSLEGTANGLLFGVSGLRDTWSVNMAPPAGDTLHAGPFVTTRRGAIRDLGGLDIYGDGRGCNRSRGRFKIHEIRFDAAGNVTALWADLVQHCEGAVPALRATIHYHA